MLRAFSTAATGMTAQQMIVDTIANNLANINTVGFKRSQVDFQDLMYVKLLEPGQEVAAGVIAPSGFEIGSGVRPASTLKVFTQGEMQNTGRSLDVAIQGDGFFQVTLPGGETRYTRDGSLRVNANGQLTTSSGYTLEPAITIPSDARSISIGEDGTVSVFAGSSGSPSTVGTIALVRFSNPAGLTNEGGNLLAQSPASGAPISGTAGQGGFGTIMQAFLERSNVQMVNELVNLITAQRAYEINSRAIRAGDEMLTTANRLIS
ncbi:MAG: flagellar basal-body rod protein FlgG [Phycisphaerae bacterium SM23_33]|jgi:flagellar basal-body rod protein FlgG|nr:MAG: flagellar basal-body rod protein FlgG [Phycisphaerae bacterium SM23_33]